MWIIDFITKLFAPSNKPDDSNMTTKEDIERIKSQIDELRESMEKLNQLAYNTAGGVGTLSNRFEKLLEELAAEESANTAADGESANIA